MVHIRGDIEARGMVDIKNTLLEFLQQVYLLFILPKSWGFLIYKTWGQKLDLIKYSS